MAEENQAQQSSLPEATRTPQRGGANLFEEMIFGDRMKAVESLLRRHGFMFDYSYCQTRFNGGHFVNIAYALGLDSNQEPDITVPLRMSALLSRIFTVLAEDPSGFALACVYPEAKEFIIEPALKSVKYWEIQGGQFNMIREDDSDREILRNNPGHLDTLTRESILVLVDLHVAARMDHLMKDMQPDPSGSVLAEWIKEESLARMDPLVMLVDECIMGVLSRNVKKKDLLTGLKDPSEN
ncbi:hypothetical protein F4677DRAFT_445439 [Hypoxylon crocopeplum]|nr:hypothetical protein F4677DRAFT_445439 [Hypoxylon crocopeplum]